MFKGELTFSDSEIYFLELGNKEEVMMDWEDTLMSASAAYACSKGGDIVEMGFGMGISATYIQQHDIKSHTICECHPDIIKKAYQWAKDKPNVTIIEGGWYENLNQLGEFDGLFFDTYNDFTAGVHFSSSLSQLVKKGGVATWWNARGEASNSYRIPNVKYQEFKVNPPSNNYFNHKTYYLPKWQH